MESIPNMAGSSKSMIFRAVLDESFSEEIATLSVCVAVIREARNVSTVVKSLNMYLPIARLQHLKRVKKTADNKLLVVLKHTIPNDAKRMKMDEEFSGKLDSIRGMLENFHEATVPADAPRTRAQFEKCMKLWPVNFHPDKHIEELVNNEMFGIEEQAWHEYCMRCAVEKAVGVGAPVAVIADPTRKLIIATGVDGREKHPLNHSTMVLLNAVAATQLGHNEKEDKPYLCTNWDVYLSREPCPMCAMALIHSRARRVFINEREPRTGAFVSRCQVQFLKQLNHHYQVFETA